MEKVNSSIIRQNIKRILWVNLVNSIFFVIIVTSIILLAVGKGNIYIAFLLSFLIFVSLILLVFEVVTGLALKRDLTGDKNIERIALYPMWSLPFVPFILASIWIIKNTKEPESVGATEQMIENNINDENKMQEIDNSKND